MSLRIAAKLLLGTVLAAGLLAWVLRGVDRHELGRHVLSVAPGTLLLGTVVLLSQSVFRVWRWRALLAPVRRDVPFRPMFDAVILGYMTSWTIPGRLGELVRPALLSGREGLPLGPCVGSVVADRLLDALGVMFLFGVALPFTPLAAAAPAGLVRAMALGAIVVVILLGALVAVSASRERVERLLRGRGRLLGWTARAILALARGCDALKEPRLLARVVVHTILVWGLIGLGTWIGLRACGALVPLGSAFVIMPALALGVALPTPGGAGGYHVAMRYMLSLLFGVDGTTAASTALVVHAINIVPVVLLGAALLFVDRIPLGDLARAARQVRDLGASEKVVP